MQTKDVKLVFVGDSQVGKTSILNRFINKEFDMYQQTSLGAM